jgi:hypothetical protein
MDYFTAVFALVISIACFWFSRKITRLYLKVSRWSRVPAAITSKEIFVHPKNSASRAPYGLKVTYIYTLGNTYTGLLLDLIELAGGQTNHMKAQAEKRANELPSSLLVYVDPSDPQRSVVHCKGVGLYVIVFFIGLLSLLIGIGMLLK